MKYYLITLYQLIMYVIVGLPLLILYPIIRLILGKRRSYKYVIIVDILVCVLAHGEFRTISGMTGEKGGQSRYKHQLKVINFLLKPFDGEMHCERAHIHEINIEYNYYLYFKG